MDKQSADGSPEREVALTIFNSLFIDDMSMNVEDLRVALACTGKIWTWTRLREKAEQAGQSAESIARFIGLAD